ncbi:hypothetical protein PS723_00574 [Pseudomonas fluorescens]|uniref:Uncharacterized protein n=1 Tax=Pseudomonas fluorescens TaxID=294 RepID=A0A5E7ABF8_PSEFL|nr:hypothetical protein PS723_00574 [Pseudomonas fluorescens]
MGRLRQVAIQSLLVGSYQQKNFDLGSDVPAHRERSTHEKAASRRGFLCLNIASSKLNSGRNSVQMWEPQAFLVLGRKIANTPNSGKNEHRKYTYSIP